MALPDFGTCLNVIFDWPLSFNYASGLLNLGNNLCRRLQTIRGSLSWDPDCGYDVRGLLRGSLSQADLSRFGAEIAAECEKDERVEAATAEIVYSQQTQTMRIAITVVTAAGPFVLVLSVDDLTVEILSLSSAGAA